MPPPVELKAELQCANGPGRLHDHRLPAQYRVNLGSNSVRFFDDVDFDARLGSRPPDSGADDPRNRHQFRRLFFENPLDVVNSHFWRPNVSSPEA